MAIEIRPVSTSRERRLFLTFPWCVFRGDRMWVPPVLSDLEARLDPQRGAWFSFGTAESFIAWRHGQPVGTICCAEDRIRNAPGQRQDAVFGFNHYLPEYAVATALWEHAATWARERRLDTLFGPFNLDYEDSYGILIEGYDRPPVLMCGHTPPYYREFVERYGFRPARGQNIAYEMLVDDFRDPVGPMAKLHRAAQIVQKRGRVTVRAGNMNDWDNEIDRLLLLLNAALAVLEDFLPWDRTSLAASAHDLRAFIDPDLVLFGEAEGRVVGFLLGLPNLNEALMHANGLLYPWDKLQAWWALRTPPACLCVKSILVLPEYWGRGVDALMCYEMGQRAAAKGYRWVDLSITSADNPMTPRLAERLGGRIYKRWQVYMKPVSPGKEVS